MHADKSPFSLDFAIYQRHLFDVALVLQVADGEKIAVNGGQSDIHHPFDSRWARAVSGAAIFFHGRIVSVNFPVVGAKAAKGTSTGLSRHRVGMPDACAA
jgi:hypothetical protein